MLKEAHREQALETLLTSKVVEQVARNILNDVTIYKTSILDINAKEPIEFPKSGTGKIKFGIGEKTEGGGFSSYHPASGIGQPIMEQLIAQGLDITSDGMDYVVNLGEAKYRELAEEKEQDDDTSREGIETTLSGPDEEQQARIDALVSLTGIEVENDKSFVARPGIIEAFDIDDHYIRIRFLMHASMETENQGGILIDKQTGEVMFDSANTKCNIYFLRSHEGQAVEVADNFIKQLKAAAA